MHRSHTRSVTAFLRAVILLTLLACWSDRPTAPSDRAEPPHPLAPSAVVSGVDVLIGAGQLATCDGTNDEKTAALLDNISGTVFTAGDNIRASGSATDYINCYGPSWGRHLGRTRPSPGELDYQTSGASGYFGYFGAAAGEAGKGYYSYDLGQWHIIALNSSISTTETSDQLTWLRADLAANPRQCILAYWHYPRFSSRLTGVRSSVKPFWDALYAAGADVVVNAHYRIYERFAPQTPDEVLDPARGIREFIVGTGGHGSESPFTPRPNSQVRNSGVFGVLKLTLEPGKFSWDFVPIAGPAFTDSGSDLCDRTSGQTAASVTVAPASPTIVAGTTVQLTATVKAADGSTITRPVTWSTSAPAVATVSATGLVTGVAQGTATITATSDGRAGTATVSVTPSGPPSGATFVGAGDIASCLNANDEATAKLLDAIPGTVFAAGDDAYENGTLGEFQTCYGPTWGRHKSRTLPATGNHEYQTTDAAGYFDYFGGVAGPVGKGWYSTTVGTWHVIVLNSNCTLIGGCGATSEQGKWLAADLAANPTACTVAIWHHPRFRSGGIVGGSGLSDLWKLLYNANADLILNGHAHFYERFAPQTVSGTADPVRGIREFIVGTGGKSLNTLGTAIPNSEVRSNSTYGVLKLTLGSGQYGWQFVPVAGKTFTDQGTGNCH
jgi:uncharacterized protein YjdB